MAPDVINRRASAHRQALRAASRIAFTLGALGSFGCIEGAPGADDATLPEDESDGALDAAPEPDLAAEPDPAAERDALIEMVAEDARVDVEGEGELVDDSDADGTDADVSDALPDVTPSDDTRAGCAQVREESPDAWIACCEAINWDFNRDPACAAWGPPMPPAMPSPTSLPSEVV